MSDPTPTWRVNEYPGLEPSMTTEKPAEPTPNDRPGLDVDAHGKPLVHRHRHGWCEKCILRGTTYAAPGLDAETVIVWLQLDDVDRMNIACYLAEAQQREGAVTHGRHCPCSACAREDWTNPNLAHCGMHGPSCPREYAPEAQQREGAGS